jgi:hypothetical protein
MPYKAYACFVIRERNTAGNQESGTTMVTILRCNDIILLGAVEALLKAADIPCLLADQHMSALEGSIGAFPRRLMVLRDDEAKTRRFLTEAGYAAELVEEQGRG